MSETIRLWSVTTLIKLGLGTSDALVNWAVNTTAEAAYDRHKILAQFVEDQDRAGAVKWLKDQRWQKSGSAAARGTEVHRAAEALAIGEAPPEVSPEVVPYIDQYLAFLRDHEPEFLLAEAPVYNLTHGYAGTLDAVLRIAGKTVVADIKTTPHGPHSERMRPPYPEAALQLTAYRRAEHVGILAEQRYSSGKRYYLFDPAAQHESMPKTDGAVCVVVSPEDYMVVPVRTDDQVWRHFRHVTECARWQVDVSRDVFGPAIAPTVREVVA